MKRSFGTFRLLLTICLALTLLWCLALAGTHTHLADQGRALDISCPICSFLMGFTLCLIGISLLVIALRRMARVLSCTQRYVFSETFFDLDARGPPSL